MDKPPPTLDMQPDGTFRMVDPAPWNPGSRPFAAAVRMPLSMKLILGAVVVGVLGLSLAIAAAAISILSMLLPVIIIAGGVAWATLKWRRWQSLRGRDDGPTRAPRFRR